MSSDKVCPVIVGVVIPCRNEAHWIGEVLDALAAQDRRPDDVVVVDDGSSDGTAAAVAAWPHGTSAGQTRPDALSVRVIAGPQRGVAAAVNAGVAALRTEVVVRLDGHCRPENDYVRRTTALVMEDGVGVAGGAWTIRPSAQTLQANAIAIAVQHPMGSGGAAYRGAGERASRYGADPPSDMRVANVPARPLARAVDTVPFGCFRRSLWQDLNGLDERLWSNEDYDFNFRVRERGLRVMLDPTIRCTYYARPTLRALARQYGRYGWWKAQMLRHHPRAIRWRQLIPAMLLPALLVCAVGMALRPERLWPNGLVSYPLAVLAGAIHAGVSRRQPAATPWIAGAFFTVHLFWSAGFWSSLLSSLTRPSRRVTPDVPSDTRPAGFAPAVPSDRRRSSK
jgi:glycosyltransferase involved in cell wall biosynthesis